MPDFEENFFTWLNFITTSLHVILVYRNISSPQITNKPSQFTWFTEGERVREIQDYFATRFPFHRTKIKVCDFLWSISSLELPYLMMIQPNTIFRLNAMMPLLIWSVSPSITLCAQQTCWCNKIIIFRSFFKFLVLPRQELESRAH